MYRGMWRGMGGNESVSEDDMGTLLYCIAVAVCVCVCVRLVRAQVLEHPFIFIVQKDSEESIRQLMDGPCALPLQYAIILRDDKHGAAQRPSTAPIHTLTLAPQNSEICSPELYAPRASP